MGEWEFRRIPGPGRDEPPYLWSWRYRRSDGTVVCAPETFRFFLDCVAHARLHGYVNGPLRTPRETATVRPSAGTRYPQVAIHRT